MTMKLSDQVKKAGLPDLNYIASKTGKPVQTLRSWAKQYPDLFKTVLDGCVVQYQAEQQKPAKTLEQFFKEKGFDLDQWAQADMDELQELIKGKTLVDSHEVSV